MLKRICYFKTKADRRPAAGLSSANFCQFFWLFSNYHYFSSQTSEHSEHCHYYLSEKLLCPFNNFPLLCSTFISIPLFHVEWAPAGGVMCGLNKERGIQSLRGIFDLQGTRKKHFLSFSTLRRYVDKSIDKISMVDVRFFPFFPLLIHLFIVGYICLSVMLNMYKEQIDMSLLIGIYRIYLTLEIKSFSSQLINLYLNLNTF